MIEAGTIKVAAYVALLAGLVWVSYDYGRTVERDRCSKARVNDTEQVINRTEVAKGVTQQRLDTQKEAQDGYVEQTGTDDRRLRDAESVNRRLQQRVTDLQHQLSNRSGDSALAVCRTAASTLGGLLGSCTAEYIALGRDAAEDRASGTLCERSYDALIRSGTQPTGEPQSSGSDAAPSGTLPVALAQVAQTAPPSE